MAKEGQTATSGLDGLVGAAKAASNRGPPPIHLWNPAYCGEIDMRIATDGTWFYQKTPIGRPALVRLFASIIKREGERYFLVTPVEKCGILVDDAPFLAVELQILSAEAGRVLRFRTNVDDWVDCGPEHPLRFEPEPETGSQPSSIAKNKMRIGPSAKFGKDNPSREMKLSSRSSQRLRRSAERTPAGIERQRATSNAARVSSMVAG